MKQEPVPVVPLYPQRRLSYGKSLLAGVCCFRVRSKKIAETFFDATKKFITKNFLFTKIICNFAVSKPTFPDRLGGHDIMESVIDALFLDI